MLIIGIDPSSKKLAFCTTELPRTRKAPLLQTISLPVGVYRAAGHAYREAFLFFQQNPGVVYMEAPVVGRSPHPTIVQSQVGGAVMAAAENAGTVLHLVNNASWKKQVVGKGNAQKEEVCSWLQEFWPEAYDLAAGDQDLIDACAINRYGSAHQRLAQKILTRSGHGIKATAG
jgi:Holliday junction resolvasome RuvABC endonuclease subunit